MPESGDQSYKTRGYGSPRGKQASSSGASLREPSPVASPPRNEQPRQVAGASRETGRSRSSISLWQRLFGQTQGRSLRKSSQRKFPTNGSSKSSGAATLNVRDDLEISRERFQALRGQARNGSTVRKDGRQIAAWRDRPNGAGAAHPKDTTPSPRRGGMTSSAPKPRQADYPTTASQGFQAWGLKALFQKRTSPSTGVPSPNQAQLKLAARRNLQQRTETGMSPFSQGLSVPATASTETFQNSAAGRSRQRKANTPSRRRSRSFAAVLYATRLLILSVGVGVLAGTVLSVWDPANRSFTAQQQPVKQAGVSGIGQGDSNSLAQQPKVGQEMTTLKAAMQTLTTKNTQMTPGVFVMDLDTNAYVDLNGSATFSAASMIKVPVLVAFFQEVDAGKIRLDEPMELRKELIGSGSGDMQYATPGTRYTALDVATKMITISDNTATNLLIARLGGIRALNQRFRSWGLNATVINNFLPDLEGTNATTPKELAFLLGRISQGDLISMRSRDRLLDIMRRTENHSQLRQGLGTGATIAHKTGDIGSLIGDTGMVDLPNGKRYVITVMVKRSFNDDRAYDFVSQFSRLAYLYFSRPPVTPKSVAPAASPTTQQPAPRSTEVQPSPSDTGTSDNDLEPTDSSNEDPSTTL